MIGRALTFLQGTGHAGPEKLCAIFFCVDHMVHRQNRFVLHVALPLTGKTWTIRMAKHLKEVDGCWCDTEGGWIDWRFLRQ